MGLFVGTYEHNVDSKGRVSVPSQLRRYLSGEVIVTKGPVQALYIFTPAGYENWIMKLFSQQEGGYNPRSSTDAKLMRDATKDAYPVNIDSAGRINLPEVLREKAGINKEVSIIGSFDHFEIWDKESWREHDSESKSYDGYFHDQ